MDTSSVLDFVKESVFVLTVFGVFLLYAMAKGRYAVITVIFSMYLALLISFTFPYYDQLTTASGGDALAKILVFIAFIIAGVILLRRHIPGDDYENAFQSFWRKVLVALMATILVMAFSFQALPVTEIIDPGTPMQTLFGPQENFFWWLTLPLIALFFL